MALIRMDIQSVVVGAGPVASLVVLKPRNEAMASKLPIRIGTVEAAAISMGVEHHSPHKRPMTHDLLQNVIANLGARVESVCITDVHNTTFYAQVCLTGQLGEPVSIDARPSDALALAVRTGAPIFAQSEVLDTAALPDFAAIEKDERKREEAAFHDFVEGLSPEDFE